MWCLNNGREKLARKILRSRKGECVYTDRYVLDQVYAVVNCRPMQECDIFFIRLTHVISGVHQLTAALEYAIPEHTNSSNYTIKHTSTRESSLNSTNTKTTVSNVQCFAFTHNTKTGQNQATQLMSF